MLKDNSKRLGDRIEERDEAMIEWSKVTKQKMLRKLLSLGLRERIRLSKEKPLLDSIYNRIKKRDGELESIAFSFARSGIWVEHGVGKGRPKGSSHASLVAKPWIAPTLSPAIEGLADILSEKWADIAAEELRLLIPGVMDTKIKIG